VSAPPRIDELAGADGPSYDELRDAHGELRPHWRGFVNSVTASGRVDLLRQAQMQSRRLIVENGVTYNVYADPQGTDRPWTLDPLPLILTATEWDQIAAGVAQRARLLDALLADLYGAQRLLSEGLVPPALTFGHPNFLWPCRVPSPTSDRWLHFYAADLARAPDGRWWLLADRTQAPSGAGYALENREILEQVHAERIGDVGVRSLRGFFGELRERLLQTDVGEDSIAVLLTSGPFNETYFEHAYLARQLGVPLVEGHDLTVRADTVYLKTLAGLRRVHTILRRLDDDWCDPLELRGDSALGVPGLIGALRARRVTVANAPGTGVLESAAWLGFIPPLAERLLGESLQLPSVASWWCGEPPALEYVLANLDHLVIKPAYPNQRFEPLFGRDLDAAARGKLIERIRGRPNAYVAQERVALSRAPVWEGGDSAEFTPRALTIRVYAVAGDSGYRVMHGGLARVAPDHVAEVVSTQRGGGSKDIWVLNDGGEENFPDEPTGTWQRPVRRYDTSSRLVENLFWLGRYTIRCEDKARILRSTLASRADTAVWRHALQICRGVAAVAADGDPQRVLRDERDPQGLVADLRRLHGCAAQVRNCLSARYWRTILDLQRQSQEAVALRTAGYEPLERLLLSLAALMGFSEEDMSHDDGWRLMRVGRRIERLQFIAGVLAQQLDSPVGHRPGTVEWLLAVCDSRTIYRARYRSAPRIGAMLDLLMLDDQHPTALAFQHRMIDRDLAELARALGTEAEAGLTPLPELDSEALLRLEAGDSAGRSRRAVLAQRLRAGAAEAGQLSDRLSHRHFSHVQPDAYALAI
jgi:uncharacterized circularly permuted ATP-grasp superfamily protein/uncharacterized alpha-E superfamily protein